MIEEVKAFKVGEILYPTKERAAIAEREVAISRLFCNMNATMIIERLAMDSTFRRRLNEEMR